MSKDLPQGTSIDVASDKLGTYWKAEAWGPVFKDPTGNERRERLVATGRCSPDMPYDDREACARKALELLVSMRSPVPEPKEDPRLEREAIEVSADDVSEVAIEALAE